MPAGAVFVGRQTIWGNPFVDYVSPKGERWVGIAEIRPGGCSVILKWITKPDGDAVDYFRRFVEGRCPEVRGMRALTDRAVTIRRELHRLRGRAVVCWCPLDRRCHGDVLLVLANEEEPRRAHHAHQRNPAV